MADEEEEVMGWWFAAGDELPHGDGRKVILGETLTVGGEIAPCSNGLHASVDPFDALRYAPGAMLYRVRLTGTIIPHENDKHAASERTALAKRDATPMLRSFSRKMALSVIHLWAAPAIVREYLETGDEGKRAAAWAAAWEAARAAASATASAAARAAAWEAARAAAWEAAWAAARAAAWEAARAAAWEAARAAGETGWEAAWAAAWEAARAAAWEAAWAAARGLLNEMVAQLFEGDL